MSKSDDIIDVLASVVTGAIGLAAGAAEIVSASKTY